MAIYSEFSHWKWWFSIVIYYMLVYQRVMEWSFTFPTLLRHSPLGRRSVAPHDEQRSPATRCSCRHVDKWADPAAHLGCWVPSTNGYRSAQRLEVRLGKHLWLKTSPTNRDGLKSPWKREATKEIRHNWKSSTISDIYIYTLIYILYIIWYSRILHYFLVFS